MLLSSLFELQILLRCFSVVLGAVVATVQCGRAEAFAISWCMSVGWLDVSKL